MSRACITDKATMNNIANVETFKGIDADPGGTLKLFTDYVDEMKLLFQLAFRKGDGTPYAPSNSEKKAMMLLKGGKDMKNLFQHVGKVTDDHTFDEAVEKIKTGLSERTNKIVQRNMLLANFPQGRKSFERWSQELSNAAKLIDYENYDWKQATVDAILLQTSSPKLRERALQENVTYEALLRLGIAKEQSVKGAALLEKASGQSSNTADVEEEVRRLKFENGKLKSKLSYSGTQSCGRCGRKSCQQGTKCPANGQKCSKCKKMNHFAKVCRSVSQKNQSFGQVSSAEESDSEESGGRVVVSKLDARGIGTKIYFAGLLDENQFSALDLITDTGISKTLLNSTDWHQIKNSCKFVKTSKRFRPYGTTYHLPIKGKAKVILKSMNGAQIETWVYVVDDKKEQSLLGKEDAMRLGIVTIQLNGAKEEVVHQISSVQKQLTPTGEIVSGGETQE